MRGDRYVWLSRLKEPAINAFILHSHADESAARSASMRSHIHYGASCIGRRLNLKCLAAFETPCLN